MLAPKSLITLAQKKTKYGNPKSSQELRTCIKLGHHELAVSKGMSLQHIRNRFDTQSEDPKLRGLGFKGPKVRDKPEPIQTPPRESSRELFDPSPSL